MLIPVLALSFTTQSTWKGEGPRPAKDHASVLAYQTNINAHVVLDKVAMPPALL